MTYTVAVRALCEFTAKRGDLDMRFTPSPSAQEGIAGHALVASRRGQSYESEVTLSGHYGPLIVRGRADGYDPDKNQLEEVKTFRGDLARVPDNHRALHWAQVKIYGWLLCQERQLADIRLAIVYFDIVSLEETLIEQVFTAAQLQAFFESSCAVFLVWAEQEMAHRRARDSALDTLAFAHPSFRAGQRALAEAVFKSSSQGRCLVAQAPTGIGKTIGTVFPVLKAMPRKSVDKLFFLAAKTSGRKLALDALALVKRSAPALPLRVVELVARDKSCEHPGKACHGDACPLAQGFYDRLPAARTEAMQQLGTTTVPGRESLRSIALAHNVCPYYLSQDVVRWADVVVGDYNYYFDTHALLHTLTTLNQWRVALLVDEAHNLVDRARGMYTGALTQTALASVQRSAPARLKSPLARLQRAWGEVNKSGARSGARSGAKIGAISGKSAGLTTPSATRSAYEARADLPDDFVKILGQACTALGDHLAETPTRLEPALQNFYFDALHFARLADSFGTHSIFDLTCDGRSEQATLTTTLTIRNVVPAPYLAPRLADAFSSVLFSATLQPQNYYNDLLGIPHNAIWADIESPFSAKQLQVAVLGDVSTRFRDRAQSLAPVARVIVQQVARAPGNYLVFVSSYDYLAQLMAEVKSQISASALFATGPPAVWEQTAAMTEAARSQFLAQFSADARGIGFAVLGGAFAEGIDLPGRKLIGAFIATLGLPQINPVTEAVRQRMADNFGPACASDYAYLYPGLQKVVQAAGRVIRTLDDEGVVFLMDERFNRAEVRILLPAWWTVTQARAPRAVIGNSKNAKQHQ